jgi:hypothetical protein
MIEIIESQLKWLEATHDRKHVSNASERLYTRKCSQVEKDIDKLNTFVNLKPNEHIQGYWNPIIDKWYDRLVACQF